MTAASAPRPRPASSLRSITDPGELRLPGRSNAVARGGPVPRCAPAAHSLRSFALASDELYDGSRLASVLQAAADRQPRTFRDGPNEACAAATRREVASDGLPNEVAGGVRPR